MLNLFKILPFLINLDQQIILNLFKTENLPDQDIINLGPSFFILKLLMLTKKHIYNSIEMGLTLTDIEATLVFILFVRFIILILRYNIKTSFYITCIGIFAGYLWYRHLIDLIGGYSTVLIKIPYLSNLGMEGFELMTVGNIGATTDKLKFGNDVAWYTPFQIIYYAFKRGIININHETGLPHYIDPLSMFISNLNEVDKTRILPYYYKTYNTIIPQIFGGITKLFNQTSGLFAYTLATRIGKRFCPYFIRWHWTFLFIIGFIEQILVCLVHRMYFFETYILIPKMKILDQESQMNLLFKSNILENVMTGLVAIHLGFILLALFHALIGQYFYIPIIVENTELHIGKKLKNSIYSGGYTPWQDERKINSKKKFPKVWYGWFGHQNKFPINILEIIQKNFQKIEKIIKKNLLR